MVVGASQVVDDGSVNLLSAAARKTNSASAEPASIDSESCFQTFERLEDVVNRAMSRAKWPFNKQIGMVHCSSLKNASWLGRSKTARSLSLRSVLLPRRGMSFDVVRTDVPNKQNELSSLVKPHGKRA